MNGNNINIINSIDDIIVEEDNEEFEMLKNYFWFVNTVLIEKLIKYFDINDTKTIIDIGGGTTYRFPFTTHTIDCYEELSKNIYNVDIDFDRYPFIDKQFYFSFCRHTLEDIQNPNNAFNEIIRTSERGYIETPSPMVEISKNVVNVINNMSGYIHHRYIVWSEKETNTLYFLPKYPVLEYIIFKNTKKFNYVLNNYPIYWNNYYIWDDVNKPNIFVYRHGINFTIDDDYINILNRAIYKSFEYTNILSKIIQ